MTEDQSHKKTWRCFLFRCCSCRSHHGDIYIYHPECNSDITFILYYIIVVMIATHIFLLYGILYIVSLAFLVFTILRLKFWTQACGRIHKDIIEIIRHFGKTGDIRYYSITENVHCCCCSFKQSCAIGLCLVFKVLVVISETLWHMFKDIFKYLYNLLFSIRPKDDLVINI